MKLRLTLAALSLAGLFHAASAQEIDPLFDIGTGASARVASAVMQPDGRVVIGGSFTTYNGASAVRVARLLRDGSHDPAFNVGTGAVSQVTDVALAPDGKVYVVGNFTSFNGTARNRIVRLNTNGSVDTGFDPGTGFNVLVTQVLVQPDGRVVCTGDFTQFNGTGRNRVARLNTDGTLDTTFDPGTGANFVVTSLDRQADGKFLIGGYFNDYNGNLVIGLARVNNDGSLDTSYNLGGSGLDNAVSTILILPDGKAMLGGLFTSYNGTGRNRILRLHEDGTLDTSFDPGTGAGNDVLAIARQSDGALLVGGLFSSFNGTPRSRVCRITADGTLDPTWTAGASDAVNTILWIPDGKAIIGGLFTTYNSAPRNRVVCVNALCTDEVEITIKTDGAGDQTSWEIVPEGYEYVVCAGSGLPNNTEVVATCCLAEGCYDLRVKDAAGDGIAGGGYVLRSGAGDRIIDNDGNFTTGNESSATDGFCVPVGTDRPIHSNCDRYTWQSGDHLVATENAAVSAQYGVTNTTSGYEFWFFDPNGGLSFRKFRNHAIPDGASPDNALRACHIKLNNWSAANHLQNNVLYNVRVRGVVDGAEFPFGPACRMILDPVAAACPHTGLNNIDGHPNFSCGVTRTFGGPNSAANRVYARSVGGANLYEWEFSNVSEGYLVTRQTTTVIRHLNWTAGPPMLVGSTYQVRVRARKGAVWCDWGWVCDVTIGPGVAPGGESFAGGGLAGMAIWPNPSNGQQLFFSMDEMSDEVRTVSIDIHDLSGKRVAARQIPAQHGAMNVELNGIAAGTYVVTITAGDQRSVERLVITEGR